MKLNGPVLLASTLLIAAAGIVPVMAQDIPSDYREVLTTLGRKGDFADNVLKVGIPRNDLNITVAGIKTPTPFGFGGWLGLTKGDRGMDVMMGDLVLLQEEVNPVMSALLDNGLEVTALHNHFFWDEPHVFYMHVHGHGKALELAKKVKPALDLIGHVQPIETSKTAETQRAISASAYNQIVEEKLDKEALDRIVGRKGDAMGTVYKYTIGRDDLKLREMGAVINARMGLNTWAAFVGTDANAAVAGDVAMLESEVTSVLKVLRRNGLDVVAIHHHMTGARPMIIFLHYWGVGPAERLATGFKAALDELARKGRGAAHRDSHD